MKIFLPLLLFPFTLFAQNFQAHYGTVHDEDAYSMMQTADHGFVICGGSIYTGAGAKDAMLMKTNQGGALSWSKNYGGTGDETAIYVKEVPAGGFVFCGETFSATPNGDAFLARTDSAGNLLWWKNYGFANYDIAYSVKPLNDGGFIVVGLTELPGTNYDAFVIRTDQNGDTLWTRTYGGPGIDHAVQIIPTSDNGFLFSGKILSYSAGISDVWLMKLDANGDTLWTSEIGGPGWDEGMDLLEIANGYMVCGGTNSSGAGDYDFLLMQVDATGHLNWAKTYGGPYVEDSYCIKEVPAGGYVFTGYTETFGPGHNRGTDSANAFVMRVNTIGDTLWTMAYGGALKEECFAIDNTIDEGFAITGYTGSFGDSLQAYLFKTDSLGYSGCNERRAQPTINIPNLSELHHSVTVGSAIPYSSLSYLALNNGAAGYANCGGPLSVTDSEEHELALYPNPTKGELFLNATEGRLYSVKVMNCFGQVVYAASSVSAHSTIDLSELPDGIYFLQMESGNTMMNKKIIKKEN